MPRDSQTHPSAKAPDHWRRNPNNADMMMADALFQVQLKDNTPGGSSNGIKTTKKNIEIGLVFHINLVRWELI